MVSFVSLSCSCQKFQLPERPTSKQHWCLHFPLTPATCFNPIGWHQAAATFHRLHSSLYKPRTGLSSFFLILDAWSLDRQVVPICRWEITTTRCIITQKYTFLKKNIFSCVWKHRSASRFIRRSRFGLWSSEI